VTVLGAYSRASNLSGRLQEAGYRLSEVMLPGLSQACRGGDYAGAAASFSWWRRLVALGLGAACAPAAGAAVGLLAVFGPGFSTAALPLAIMLVGYATVVLSLVHSSLLLALERPGVVSRMVLLRCAVALALVGPLTLALGATGAALALTAGFLVEFAVILRRTDRELRPTGAAVSSLPWGRLVVALVLSAGTARLVDVALEGVLGTLAALLAGLAVFAGVAIATGQVQRSELQEGVRRVSGRGRSVAAAGGPPEPPGRSSAVTEVVDGSRGRVGLFVSTDLFEHFYGDALGLTVEQYLASYRNEWSWDYMSLLRGAGVEPTLYVASRVHDGLHLTADGFRVRFLRAGLLYRLFERLPTMRRSALWRWVAGAVNGLSVTRGLRRAGRVDRLDLLLLQEYWTGRLDVLAHTLRVPLVAMDHGMPERGELRVFKARALARLLSATGADRGRAPEGPRLRPERGQAPERRRHLLLRPRRPPGPRAGRGVGRSPAGGAEVPGRPRGRAGAAAEPWRPGAVRTGSRRGPPPARGRAPRRR
jgi:hypothetical protein